MRNIGYVIDDLFSIAGVIGSSSSGEMQYYQKEIEKLADELLDILDSIGLEVKTYR